MAGAPRTDNWGLAIFWIFLVVGLFVGVGAGISAIPAPLVYWLMPTAAFVLGGISGLAFHRFQPQFYGGIGAAVGIGAIGGSEQAFRPALETAGVHDNPLFTVGLPVAVVPFALAGLALVCWATKDYRAIHTPSPQTESAESSK